jgi:hypothetical protein
VKIGPELTMQANRAIEPSPKFIAEIWSKKMLSKFLSTLWDDQNPENREDDLLVIALKRAAELNLRGYPQSWIEKDLERLLGGL